MHSEEQRVSLLPDQRKGLSMYSMLRNIQIVVASLKAHGIKKVVHCPGGSDAPIGISFDTDAFFDCYSVVDERSALFFAIGMSLAGDREPVAVVCTSGTAVSNLSSGMAEAYYKGVPIVAITADRSPYLLDQFEIQKIDQRAIFSNCAKYEADLPLVDNDDQARYCDRLVNEALLELTSGMWGPVHLNVPVMGRSGCYAAKLPDTKTIHRHLPTDPDADWAMLARSLASYEKVMVIVGENVGISERTLDAMSRFFASYNCMFSVEHMSNCHIDGTVMTYRATEAMASGAFDALCPDLVIDFGGHVATVKLKAHLRERAGRFAHWSVREDGSVRDGFFSLTDVFWCDPGYFFDKLACLAPAGSANDREYLSKWKTAVDAVDPPTEGLTNFSVARELARRLPEGSFLELGILNSVRVAQFFDISPDVTVSANLGALGIDGCLSTAVGVAAAAEREVFIMQGDLSFFYDMNALGIRYAGSNLHVLVVNNNGASEFHINGMAKAYPDVLDVYLAAGHEQSAEGWARQCGFSYIGIREASALSEAMGEFARPGAGPILMEVFTSRYSDSELLDSFYADNSGATSAERAKSMAKDTAKRLLSLGRR
ncbi:2-succinyl-5-enolpyruvyl-6-hydroxy-3-cyclohexene-1-carboxylate synthase [Adlercreutzia sp. ZJ176]|nr:thiamine pyrophosphate-binding protein [Adlercreutzia sp. ZJ176]